MEPPSRSLAIDIGNSPLKGQPPQARTKKFNSPCGTASTGQNKKFQDTYLYYGIDLVLIFPNERILAEIFCSCHLKGIWFLNPGALVRHDAGFCGTGEDYLCVLWDIWNIPHMGFGWGGWVCCFIIRKSLYFEPRMEILTTKELIKHKVNLVYIGWGFEHQLCCWFMWIDKKAILKVLRV